MLDNVSMFWWIYRDEVYDIYKIIILGSGGAEGDRGHHIEVKVWMKELHAPSTRLKNIWQEFMFGKLKGFYLLKAPELLPAKLGRVGNCKWSVTCPCLTGPKTRRNVLSGASILPKCVVHLSRSAAEALGLRWSDQSETMSNRTRVRLDISDVSTRVRERWYASWLGTFGHHSLHGPSESEKGSWSPVCGLLNPKPTSLSDQLESPRTTDDDSSTCCLPTLSSQVPYHKSTDVNGCQRMSEAACILDSK